MDKFVTRSPPDTKSNPKKRKADEIATSDDEGSGSGVKETKKIILKNKGPAPKKQKTSNKSEVLELQPSLHENFNEDITKILLGRAIFCILYLKLIKPLFVWFIIYLTKIKI
jgi:hypothetical protein